MSEHGLLLIREKSLNELFLITAQRSITTHGRVGTSREAGDEGLNMDIIMALIFIK